LDVAPKVKAVLIWPDRRPGYSQKIMVLKGSKFRKRHEPSCPDKAVRLKEDLVDKGKLVREESDLVLNEDIIFGSPSQAANVVLGLSRNGWDVWKKKFNIGSISDKLWYEFSLSSAKKTKKVEMEAALIYYQEPENAYDVTKDSDWIDWTGNSQP
jgi:hypothetical protein